MRRIASFVTAAILVVGACTPGPAGTGSPGGGTTAGTSPGATTPAASGDVSGEIVFWTAEDNQERVTAMQAIVDRFESESGVTVELVAIAEDQLQAQITSAAAADTLPDVFGAISLGFAHSLAADGLSDAAAAQAVIDSLGRDTFSARALDLVTTGGQIVAVPSDSWTQILVYRKDLFDAAGLPAPDTFANITNAATTLNTGGRAGIVLATTADPFTQQTFEHFAVANDCQVVDDAGAVALASQNCANTFQFYTDLVRNASVTGGQDADTTRAAYFAGDAAMIVWSSFLLDELAGLREDALPTCPECESDPLFLANNSGVVTAVQGPDASEPAQFGELVSFAISQDANKPAAQAFVEFMMSDGYVDWLALAPEGKFPTRLGTADNPTEYADAWGTLEAGVTTKQPLGEIYEDDVLETLTTSADTMKRWGFSQGQGAIVGPLLVELPVPKALGAALDGSSDAAGAVAQAVAEVQAIIDSLQ